MLPERTNIANLKTKEELQFPLETTIRAGSVAMQSKFIYTGMDDQIHHLI
jgi:hypothetical protein